MFSLGELVSEVAQDVAESTLDGSLSWATQLPPEATSADQLFLYFEALDRQGEVVSSVGSTDSPTVVGIRSSGTVAASSGGGSETDVGGEGESTREESGFWWLGLGLGSGYGYAGKSGPEGGANTYKITFLVGRRRPWARSRPRSATF